MAACRDHGEVRLEGKEYIVQDGDIINFRLATWCDRSVCPGGAGAVRARRRRSRARLVARSAARAIARKGCRCRSRATEGRDLRGGRSVAPVDLSAANGGRTLTRRCDEVPDLLRRRHGRKVIWLFHQYRAVYELCGTVYSEFHPTPNATYRLRARLMRARSLRARRVEERSSATRATPPTRLARYNGLKSRAAVSSAAACRQAEGRTIRQLFPVRWTPRNREAGGT